MFRATNPARARKLLVEAALADGDPVAPVHEERPIGTALMAVRGREGFLGAVLGAMREPADQDRFLTEFGFLSNRRAAFFFGDYSDIEAMEAHAQAAYGMLQVGLAYLASEDPDLGLELLRKLPLVSVHQVGASLVERLGRRAREVLRALGGRAASELFDEPLDEVLGALCRRFPEYPEHLDGTLGGLRRPCLLYTSDAADD